MRCPQCGFDAVAGAAFCSRCGARLMMPRPESRHEYALIRIMPSWWHFAGSFVLAAVLAAIAIATVFSGRAARPVALTLMALSMLIVALTAAARRSTNWSVTSERLIQRHGFLSQRRLEIELADIRSVEVNRRFVQRLLGTGTVLVSSAASADFLIRLEDVPDPDGIAETIRQARLKRLA